MKRANEFYDSNSNCMAYLYWRVARIHEIEQLSFKYIKSTFPLIVIWDQFCNSNNCPKIWTNKKSKGVNVKNVIHWTTNIFIFYLLFRQNICKSIKIILHNLTLIRFQKTSKTLDWYKFIMSIESGIKPLLIEWWNLYSVV